MHNLEIIVIIFLKFCGEGSNIKLKSTNENKDVVGTSLVIVPTLASNSLRPKRDKIQFRSAGPETENTSLMDLYPLDFENEKEESKKYFKTPLHKYSVETKKDQEFESVIKMEPIKIEPPLLLHYKPLLWKANFSRNALLSTKTEGTQYTCSPYAQAVLNPSTRKSRELFREEHPRSKSEDLSSPNLPESFIGKTNNEYSDSLGYIYSSKNKSSIPNAFSHSQASKAAYIQRPGFASGNSKLCTAALQMMSGKLNLFQISTSFQR